MTIDEKKKLYDAIGYEDDQKSSAYPEEVSLFFKFYVLFECVNSSILILTFQFN